MSFKKYIVQRVEETAVNACPPVVVGVGLGGTMEKAALIAKKSLLRPIGQRHPRPDVAELEEDLLMESNKLGIGPLGFGGALYCNGCTCGGISDTHYQCSCSL